MLYFTPQKINMQPWSNIFTKRGTHILSEEKIWNISKNKQSLDYYLFITMEVEEKTVSRIALFLLKLKNDNSKDSIEWRFSKSVEINHWGEKESPGRF